MCVCLCCRLMGSHRPSFVSSQREEGVLYHHAFQGSHLVAWMMNNQEAATREQAVKMLEKLLQGGVLRHGESSVCALSQESTNKFIVIISDPLK